MKNTKMIYRAMAAGCRDAADLARYIRGERCMRVAEDGR